MSWGWKIVESYINPEHEGMTMKKYRGGQHRYRIKDSGDTVRLVIVSDIKPTKENLKRMREPLEWANYYHGCSIIEYLDDSGEYKKVLEGAGVLWW